MGLILGGGKKRSDLTVLSAVKLKNWPDPKLCLTVSKTKRGTSWARGCMRWLSSLVGATQEAELGAGWQTAVRKSNMHHTKLGKALLTLGKWDNRVTYWHMNVSEKWILSVFAFWVRLFRDLISSYKTCFVEQQTLQGGCRPFLVAFECAVAWWRHLMSMVINGVVLRW